MSPMNRIATAALAAVGALACSQAMAQMPADIAEKIAAIGRVVDPAKTGEIYTPLHEKEPYSSIKVARDVKYGPDPRNIVDVFTADGATGARPVLMFVHGGGLIRGNKRPPGSAFYDNVMLWAARNGMVGVNVEYRLAPAHPWPAGNEDMAAAVRSYRDLPKLLYHFQAKGRDEPRPRAGVLRTREFIMKDAYSFDRDHEGLDRSYEILAGAYDAVFDRVGLEWYSVESDVGAMGGTGAHEYMAPSSAGEDQVAHRQHADQMPPAIDDIHIKHLLLLFVEPAQLRDRFLAGDVLRQRGDLRGHDPAGGVARVIF